MGYTHYWRRKGNSLALDHATFAAIVADFNKLVAALPSTSDTASGAYRDAPLELDNDSTPDEINFNGKDDERDLGHEPFEFPRCQPDEFTFCKTARKPYDLLVCATLIVVKKHAPAVKVSTDGDPEDWAPAVTLCQTVLGYGAFPCEREEESV